MTLLVDTSVWSLALRRDAPSDIREVKALYDALRGNDLVVSTGLILQELLQGFVPERAQVQIAVPGPVLLVPARSGTVGGGDLLDWVARSGRVDVREL